MLFGNGSYLWLKKCRVLSFERSCSQSRPNGNYQEKMAGPTLVFIFIFWADVKTFGMRLENKRLFYFIIFIWMDT